MLCLSNEIGCFSFIVVEKRLFSPEKVLMLVCDWKILLNDGFDYCKRIR